MRSFLNLRNQLDVIKFLRNHEYEDIKKLPNGRIGYRDGSGDGIWESPTSKNKYVHYICGWVREEVGTCCIQSMKEDNEAMFCRDCATGINRYVSWRNISEMPEFLIERVLKTS